MRITTRGQLAVSAMTDLALHQKVRPVALSTISARQGTSLSYLEQLFSALRRAGLVDSTRGPGGGYTLARKLEQISVADIIIAVENLPFDANALAVDTLRDQVVHRLARQAQGVKRADGLRRGLLHPSLFSKGV